MFESHTYRNLLEAYPRLLASITEYGREAAPRGQPVIEHVHPILWHLRNPQEYTLAIAGRKVNPFFAMAEVVWMWSGKGGAEFITYYNKQMKQYLDDGVPYFHGAYGKRVRHFGYNERPFRELPHPMTPTDVSGDGLRPVEVDQLEHVVRKLQADPDTRQAAITLWDPIKDNFVQSKDHPCNNMLYFTQREGALHLTITMRSNDLIWGVPYNMIQFSHLLALMAGTLDLEIGSYHVMVNNLHYYKGLYPETLDKVLGWCENVTVRQIDLNRVSDSLFYEKLDMRWTTQGLDQFVSQAWEPLEKELRLSATQWTGDSPDSGADAYMNSKLGSLYEALQDQQVPNYWWYVFLVMFMFHCRKVKAPVTYNQLFAELPKALRWMVADFTEHKGGK